MESGAQPLLKATGLGVRRGSRWLIRAIDLSIDSGEILTLIGPNGGGKTTLARCLAGVIAADEGSVWRGPGTQIGYVPQRLAIDSALPMKVRRLLTLRRAHSRQAIEAALAQVGIDHLAERSLQSLSGGEFQRALLARVLVGGPPSLLILDEPTQGVDFAGEIALYRLIGEIRRQSGCGILLISHDLHVVMGQTDRVVCLNGHVCCSGLPESVAAHPEYRRLFDDRGSGDLAIYQHRHDHRHLPDGRAVPWASEGDKSS